jgi:hypothetical protein
MISIFYYNVWYLVEAIQKLKPPETLKQLRSLLGLIDYYRDMWKQPSHISTSIKELTKVPREVNYSNGLRSKKKASTKIKI